MMAQGAGAIRAVFVDLDGTLLNKQHHVSDYTAKVIRALKEQCKDRVGFVVATGRPFHYVFEQMRQYSLPVDYIISSNGCRIHSGPDLALVRAHDIPPQTVERLFHVNVERQNDEAGGAEGLSGDVTKVKTMSTNMFVGTEWLTNYKIESLGTSYPPHMQPKLLPQSMQEHLRVTNPLTPFVDATDKAAAEKQRDELFRGVHMVFFYGPHQCLLPAEQILQSDERLRNEVAFSFSLPHIIDIYPRGIDKSSAVREVCELLRVDPQHAVAFGDGQNDITMLKAVGKGFIMSNGQDSVKAAVPEAEVIGDNAEDGVAKKLVELFHLTVPSS